MPRRTATVFDATTQAALPDRTVTHLHLLRHGQVDTGGERLAYGHADLPLTAEGHAAGRALLAFVRDSLPRPTTIVSSDLSRCAVLARQLGAALGLPVVLTPALREQGMGAWEGRSWAGLTAEDEPAIQAWWADYVHARAPGGESLDELSARVQAWWAAAEPGLRGGRVIVVTHVGVLRCLLCAALSVPLDQALRFAPARGSHTHLLHSSAGFVVQSLGELPAPPPAPPGPVPGPTRPWRLALSGSAGTGKSTLGRALAAELDLPYLDEGMRRRLEAGLDLHDLSHEGFRALLWELWEEQGAAEDAAVASHGGFVADRSHWDFAAFWLHYRFASDLDETERFFAAVRQRADAVDRVLLLPWGVLPLHADGVRNPNPWLQRHFQACLEGLLAREAPADRVLRLPPLQDLTARVAWVRGALG